MRIFFPPSLGREKTLELIKNGMYPVSAVHMQRTDLLNSLPPIVDYEYHYSEFHIYSSVEYFFRMEALCHMHLASYITISSDFLVVDEEVERIKRAMSSQDLNSSEEELQYREGLHYQLLSRMGGSGRHLEEVKNYADQGFVVQLWGINEKFISRLLKMFSEKIGVEFSIPTRWDILKEVLSDFEIDVSKVLSVFNSFDELRVLNNKIKHLGEVDSALAAFPYFNAREGSKLEEFDYELQRYLESSYVFLIFLAQELFEKSNDQKLKEKVLKKEGYRLLC